MITNIKSIAVVLLTVLAGFSACKKTEYSFGDIKTPSALTLATTIEGVDVSNPDGNGSGTVVITATASNAVTYKIDFGDGNNRLVPSGAISYKYTNPGTAEYTVTVSAIGTGGAISTVSKKVKVFVAFEIPADILAAFTNGSTKTWVTARDEPGHVGVGPADAFSPIWYAAGPDARDACLYDDEITFSTDANNNIFMNIDNKGSASVIGASTGYYGFAGGDGCYGLANAGSQKLSFMNATSASTPANSTRIQFVVPGKGIVNFGTGGNTYEILSASASLIHLRNIGIDGNSWYQKLKVKP